MSRAKAKVWRDVDASELMVIMVSSTNTTTDGTASVPQEDYTEPGKKLGAKKQQKTVTAAAQEAEESGTPDMRKSKKRTIVEISEDEEESDGGEQSPRKASKRIKTAQKVAPQVAAESGPDNTAEGASHAQVDYGVRRTATGRFRKRANCRSSSRAM